MAETWPLASVITYEFPAREGTGPVKVVWYDGGLRPPRPVKLEAPREMPGDGIIYKGTKGVMLASGTSNVPHLLPETKMAVYKLPPETLKRCSGIYGEWYEAARGGETPSEHWPDCAVPLTELILLSYIAVLTGEYLQ